MIHRWARLLTAALAIGLVAYLALSCVAAVARGASPGPWRTSVATFYDWQSYGVGDYKSWHIPKAGRHPFSCGGWYLRMSIGVAHKTLPCGTKVEFTYRGRTLVVPVVDRGPFSASMDWDFTSEACLRLRHCFTGPISWRIVR